MYFDAAFSRAALSCSGVSPAACTSLSSGMEILPSGLTTTSAESCVSDQKRIERRSPAPMTYPGGITVASGAGLPALACGVCSGITGFVCGCADKEAERTVNAMRLTIRREVRFACIQAQSCKEVAKESDLSSTACACKEEAPLQGSPRGARYPTFPQKIVFSGEDYRRRLNQ